MASRTQQSRKILRLAVSVADRRQASEIRWQLHTSTTWFEEKRTFAPEAPDEKAQLEDDVVPGYRFGFTPDVREIIWLSNSDGKVRILYRLFETFDGIGRRLEHPIRPDHD